MFSHYEIAALYKKYDKDNSGRLCYDEFCGMVFFFFYFGIFFVDFNDWIGGKCESCVYLKKVTTDAYFE